MIAQLYEFQYPTIVGYILRALQLLLMPGRFQRVQPKIMILPSLTDRNDCYATTPLICHLLAARYGCTFPLLWDEVPSGQG
jgi:hypothetical protein